MTPELFKAVSSDPAAFQAELVIPGVHGPVRFGDAMAKFQARRFAAINPALKAIAAGEKPTIGRYWWEATKGASKDSDLAVCLLWLLAFSRRPLTCQVGAADADQADELRKAAKAVLRYNAWLAEAIDVQSWQIVGKRTESTCEIIAADVAGSHGARPDVLVLNELSHVTKQEFAENLMDNAAKVPNGLAVCATNAGFLNTWQYGWRELARNSDRWSFHRRAKPSPWLDRKEIAEAKRRNSGPRYRRLWFGEWSLDVGNAIPADQIEAATVLSGPMAGRTSLAQGFVAGLDLGLRRDHSALVVLQYDASGIVKLALSQSWRPSQFPGKQIPLTVVLNAVLQAHARFHLQAVVYDPHQAALMAEQLVMAGIRCDACVFTPQMQDTMAHTLLECFSDARLQIYRDTDLLRDLGRLQLKERATGWRLTAAHDEHGHADRAIALAIALPHAVGWSAEIRELSPHEYLPGSVIRSQERRLPQPFGPSNPDPRSLEALLARGASGAVHQLGGPGPRSFGPGNPLGGFPDDLFQGGSGYAGDY